MTPTSRQGNPVPARQGRSATIARQPTRIVPISPGSLALVAAGGLLGAAAREAVEQAVPTAAGAFPRATFAINLTGAFLLGLLLERLARAGPDTGWRHRARLMAGSGFLGAFTTYSTFAVESDLLVRAGHDSAAAAYAVLSLLGGVVATTGGIAVGALPRRWRLAALPLDPDVDEGPDLGDAPELPAGPVS